jgi:phosphatidylserine/phosphatidylglycerophosphate/cardiolipin synthase-like enzyme
LPLEVSNLDSVDDAQTGDVRVWTNDAIPAEGEPTLSKDQETQHKADSIPDYAASRGTRLEGILARTSDAPLREGNRLALLKNGPDTYDDWLAAIGRAQRWVHLDNYIFENDEIGNRFADALSAKAGEGVRVRVLHDWFGCLGVPRYFWRDLREAGVEVRAVNPPASAPPTRGDQARPPEVDRR